MMAFNDLALANEGLSIFKTKYVTSRSDKDRGAAMYFIRLQGSHLCEAMEIIDALTAHDRLIRVVHKCSDSATQAFDRLTLLRKGEERKKFDQYFERLRNNLTYHYDGRTTQTATILRLPAVLSRIHGGSRLPMMSSIALSVGTYGRFPETLTCVLKQTRLLTTVMPSS
jgi:hypothetical protein